MTNEILTEATLNMLTWKPSDMRNCAREIIQTAMTRQQFFADEVTFDVGASSRNCIGATFKNLQRVGIIAPTRNWRRSTKGTARGRVIWQWALVSRRRAETFLQRNGLTIANQQKELFE